MELPPISSTVETFALDRMKLAARSALSPSVAASVDVRSFVDHMTDRMIYDLRAEVLAERVLDTEAQVPFSGSRRAIVSVRMRGLWAPFLVAAVLCLVGIFVTSLPLVLGSGAVAALAVALLYLNPSHEVDVTVPVDGSVTVPATYWRKFPEATVVYPRELGGPVRFAAMGEPSYRAYEG